MNISEILRDTQCEFSGLNPGASAAALGELPQGLPDEVATLYQNHNGSDCLPHGQRRTCAARLMPVAEVMTANAALRELSNRIPTISPVWWLWTDDNSNYCGIYSEGPLKYWLCILDHEEPVLTPAFRSISSFMVQLLNEARETRDDAALDIPSIGREIPELHSNERTALLDLDLSAHFRQRYENESDNGLRRLCALCSICLTPFDSSADVTGFFNAPDTWIPEAAVRLLEVRRWKGGTEQLEALARNGGPNGTSAAIRMLAQMGSAESLQSIERLRGSLTGQKLQTLGRWTSGRVRAQPPRW